MNTELSQPLANVQSIGIGNNGALAFSDASQIMEFARLMSDSGVAVPKHLRGNDGACLAICIQASEWQFSPFAVANKSYSVNDRLAYEAQLVNAVILNRAPIKGRFKVDYEGKGPDLTCTVSATLRDTDEIVSYTSPRFADIKIKNSPLWQSDPQQQIFYFSSRSMCRRHFPDVILGVYTPDELSEERPVNTAAARQQPINPFAKPIPAAEAVVVDAEYRDEPAQEPESQTPIAEDNASDAKYLEAIDSISEAADADALTACVKYANEHLEGIQQATAKKAIQARAKALGVAWSVEGGCFQ